MSSGTSAPTSAPIAAVASTRTTIDPVAEPSVVKVTYRAVADTPPTSPSAASTPMNVEAARSTNGLASKAPRPSAATYPATMRLVATMPPPWTVVARVMSARSEIRPQAAQAATAARTTGLHHRPTGMATGAAVPGPGGEGRVAVTSSGNGCGVDHGDGHEGRAHGDRGGAEPW